MQAITKQLLGTLPYGTVLHYGPACTPQRRERWRTNGALKTWKTRPEEFRQPIKHGLRAYGYITETDAHHFHLEADCDYTGR